jgi:hypothetical protein
MAIYGWNYNDTDIPPAFKRKFAERIPYTKNDRGRTSSWMYLKGVATSEEERDAMISTTSRPGRQVHVVTRKTAGAPWYGLYVASVNAEEYPNPIVTYA